jgi:hypothetical protein
VLAMTAGIPIPQEAIPPPVKILHTNTNPKLLHKIECTKRLVFLFRDKEFIRRSDFIPDVHLPAAAIK